MVSNARQPYAHYGDIFYVDFDPAAGHEQIKRRPAVVVSNSEFNRETEFALMVPVTHSDNGHPLHVALHPVRIDNRGRQEIVEGFAQVEQIKSLDLTYRNAVKVGEADPRDLQRITELLVACIIQPDLLVVSSN